MPLLFAANAEGTDGLTGTVNISTAIFRTNYSRATYRLGGGSASWNAAVDTPLERFVFKYWVSQLSNNGLGNQQWFLEIRDGSDARIRLHPDTTMGGLAVRVVSVDGAIETVLFISDVFRDTPTANGAIDTFTLEVDINYAEEGWVRLYIDEILVGEFLGDPREDGSVTLDNAMGRGMRNVSFSWSEHDVCNIMIADESLRGVNLVTMSPNGAGFENEWVGSYTDINNAGEPNANIISSDAADERYVFNVSDIASGIGLVTIKELIVRSVAQRGLTGPQELAQQIRVGSTNYEGAPHELDVGFALVEDRWPQNPDGPVDWNNTSLNALQIGGVSKS